MPTRRSRHEDKQQQDQESAQHVERRETPFQLVLRDFMWNQRSPSQPPLTVGQLAIRLGVSRVNVSNWITGRVQPDTNRIFTVLAQLGIPLQRFADAYRELGLTVPPLLEEDLTDQGPTPRAYTTPAAPLQDEWQEMIDRTAAAMREQGLDAATIAAVIEHVRDRQANRRPYQRHIAAEHSPSAPSAPKRARQSPEQGHARDDQQGTSGPLDNTRIPQL